MQPHLSALYRRIRAAVFSAAGRNPMGYSCSYRDELRAARTIAAVAADPPRRLRADGPLTLWRTPLGEMWAPARADEHFMRMLTIEQRLNLYGYTPRHGDVLIDCGANIGMFSKPALDRGTATIVCFEPFGENLSALRRNIGQHID